MINELKDTPVLLMEGKLDRKLRRRLGFFVVLTVGFGIIAFYDLLFLRGINLFMMTLLMGVGFLFGITVLSKMNSIKWDKKRALVTIGKFDIAGFVILALYWAVRLSAQYFLGYVYHNVVAIWALTFSFIFGAMLGRLIGVVTAIRTAEEKKK